MSEQRIDLVLVEKVAKAIHNEEWVKKGYGPWEKCVDQDRIRRLAEVEIRVVFDELGLKEERRHPAIPIPGSGTTRPGPATHTRYTSEWRPVEQGDPQ
jgi:hypothetical protein